MNMRLLVYVLFICLILTVVTACESPTNDYQTCERPAGDTERAVTKTDNHIRDGPAMLGVIS